MGLREQQNVLARIYTDPDYRRKFRNDPAGLGTSAGLSIEEIGNIASIPADELSSFSDSLFWKRRREVEKLVPLVRRALEDEYDQLFREFSDSFKSKLVKKHVEDAVGFCHFLEGRPDTLKQVKDTAKVERTRLKFFNNGSRFEYCVLRHDFRDPGTAADGACARALRKRHTLAIWLRFGSQVRHFIL